jgi:hypothetical protein
MDTSRRKTDSVSSGCRAEETFPEGSEMKKTNSGADGIDGTDFEVAPISLLIELEREKANRRDKRNQALLR